MTNYEKEAREDLKKGLKLIEKFCNAHSEDYDCGNCPMDIICDKIGDPVIAFEKVRELI